MRKVFIGKFSGVASKSRVGCGSTNVSGFIAQRAENASSDCEKVTSAADL